MLCSYEPPSLIMALKLPSFLELSKFLQLRFGVFWFLTATSTSNVYTFSQIFFPSQDWSPKSQLQPRFPPIRPCFDIPWAARCPANWCSHCRPDRRGGSGSSGNAPWRRGRRGCCCLEPRCDPQNQNNGVFFFETLENLRLFYFVFKWWMVEIANCLVTSPGVDFFDFLRWRTVGNDWNGGCFLDKCWTWW